MVMCEKLEKLEKLVKLPRKIVVISLSPLTQSFFVRLKPRKFQFICDFKVFHVYSKNI